MAQHSETEFTFDTASELASVEGASAIRGRSPWYLAWRRLRRNKVAFAALALFVLVVVAPARTALRASCGPYGAERRASAWQDHRQRASGRHRLEGRDH